MITDAPLQNRRKVYVEVTAVFTADGLLSPQSITWRDGKVYKIDKVTDVRKAASFVAGGTGVRYTCLIEGHSSFLFYEQNNKWFVEAKQEMRA